MACIGIVLVVTGCGRRPASFETRDVKLEHGACAVGNGCVRLELSYPEFLAAASRMVRDSLNAYVMTMVLKPVWPGNPQTAEALLKTMAREYERLREAFPDYTHEWNLRRIVEVEYNSPEIVSLSSYEYSYTGGAHPNSRKDYQSFDAATGRPIALADLLAPGYEGELRRIGERRFRERKGLGPADDLAEAGYWFDDGRFALNDNFAVLRDGLVFYYNDYEIGPHSLGPTEVLIPYEDIAELIDREGLLARDRAGAR